MLPFHLQGNLRHYHCQTQPDKKVTDPCLLQGVSARLPHHKWPWHVVPSIWRPARPQGSSWRAGRKDRVSGTVGRITAIPAKSYGPTFCVLVTLHPNIKTQDLYIYIYTCTYKCVYIYIRTYKSNHGWFFNENTQRYLCCQSQPGFERYFNQSQSLGRTNRWQTIFLWSLYNMLLLKRLEERTLCILAGGWWYWLFITQLAASDTHPEQVLTRQPKWPHYM